MTEKKPRPYVLCAVMAFALSAPLPAIAQSLPGDAAAGEGTFRQCASCHSVEPEQNRAGPSLFGVYGRDAAAVEGFRYSAAMRESDIVWNGEALRAFLIDPRGFLPGTAKRIALRDPADADDLIAYLRTLANE